MRIFPSTYSRPLVMHPARSAPDASTGCAEFIRPRQPSEEPPIFPSALPSKTLANLAPWRFLPAFPPFPIPFTPVPKRRCRTPSRVPGSQMRFSRKGCFQGPELLSEASHGVGHRIVTLKTVPQDCCGTSGKMDQDGSTRPDSIPGTKSAMRWARAVRVPPTSSTTTCVGKKP
jgi:hypothetical protein